MRLRMNLTTFTAAVLVSAAALAQTSPRAGVSSEMPRLVKQDGRFALFIDGAPYLMLGAQVNNSSAWPGVLGEVWPAIDRLHANTVEAPVYWAQFEPAPGRFDFSSVDTLLAQARQHHVHLVLLWFATWKNGAPHYVPDWLKLGGLNSARLIDSNGMPRDTVSPYSSMMLAADTAAFRTLMRHLKASDPRHTVIMIQVENEVSPYGSVRDFSPAAQQAFNGPVPAQLLTALHKSPGTWQQVFGAEASDTFETWSIARYVEHVAAAGKAEYPLPLYLNHSLSDPLRPPRPGRLSSDDTTNHVLDIWKAAAPSIDLIAPDIYMSDYARYIRILDLYHRPDNALFVPETGTAPPYARYFFAALGHQAIGWSPFGMDLTAYSNAPLGAPVMNDALIDTFALNYKLIGPMDREIARLNFEGKLQAVCEDPSAHTQTMDFGPWTATVSYGLRVFGFARTPPGNAMPTGRALVAQLAPNQFLVTGISARVDFRPTDTAGNKHREFVSVEEGAYVNGTFKVLRRWNGDQTDYGLNFTGIPQVLRVTLTTF